MDTVAPRPEESELKALSDLLTEKARKGRLSGISFLLADNRDCSPNDFAHDIRVMLGHYYGNKTKDITEDILKGKFRRA